MALAGGFVIIGLLVLAGVALAAKAGGSAVAAMPTTPTAPTTTGSGPAAPGGLKGGGLKLLGKVSWFGGPNDPTAGPTTASGAPVTDPGIAVYNHQTLGGWWRVTFPNGRTVNLKQTDIGPAPWTGRVLDVTYSALGLAGYDQQNFPTDGQITAVYLGQ